MKLPLPTSRDILKIYAVTAAKRLSQNFLLKSSVNGMFFFKLQLTKDQIVKSSGYHNWRDSFVVEIGPGPGTLTRSLLRTGALKVVGIEKDTRFTPILQQLSDASNQTFDFIQGDVLDVTHENIIQKLGLTEKSLETASIHLFELAKMAHKKIGIFKCPNVELTFMFQEEVGERIVAEPGTRQRSRLSIMAQAVFYPKMTMIVPKESFFPPPNINAAVVNFKLRKDNILQGSIDSLELIVKQVFRHRNKHLTNSLIQNFPQGLELLKEAGIDPSRRAVSLTVAELCQLTHIYEKLASVQ